MYRSGYRHHDCTVPRRGFNQHKVSPGVVVALLSLPPSSPIPNLRRRVQHGLLFLQGTMDLCERGRPPAILSRLVPWQLVLAVLDLAEVLAALKSGV